MSLPFIDTDIIIRLLTGDDPIKQDKAARLFKQVEQGGVTLAAPDTVIADAVYVLSSRRLYNLPRQHIADLLVPLVRMPEFRVQNRRAVLAALAVYGYGKTKLDFGDALIIGAMQQSGSQVVYSFDADFDKIEHINRQEP